MNGKNISNHHFCIYKLDGLRDKHSFVDICLKITPNDTFKLCLEAVKVVYSLFGNPEN